MARIGTVLLFICAALLFMGCTYHPPVGTISVSSSISPSTTITPKSTQINSSRYTSTPIGPKNYKNTEIVENSNIRKIITGQNVGNGSGFRLWWHPDSSAFYVLFPTGIWEYSIAEETNKLISPPPIEPTSTPDLSDKLPAQAYEIIISPTTEHILYLIPIDELIQPLKKSTPTVSSTSVTFSGVGEGDWPRLGLSEVWIWKDGKSTKAGQIDRCSQDYLWSDDESKVIITAIEPPARCADTYAWEVNIPNGQIKPLFPKNKYTSEVVILDISPNGTHLLYNTNNTAHVMSLNSLQTELLKIPRPTDAVWIDNHRALFTYPDAEGNGWKLSEYDLDNSNLTELIRFEDILELKGKRLNRMSISPDYRWLAFTAGKDRYSNDSIWLMDLQ